MDSSIVLSFRVELRRGKGVGYIHLCLAAFDLGVLAHVCK